MTGEEISPLAGKPAPTSILVDVDKLLAAYADIRPDPSDPAQRVVFGTSGHRGSSLDGSFNEWHILAITQAICDYRAKESVTGPLYIGFDTHALSQPAFRSALAVLGANGVDVFASKGAEFTPTPAISHAILTHNRGRDSGFADGIVITPSHNPPDNGGFKYNPVNGGPAGTDITRWVQHQANQYLENKLAGVRRIPFVQACTASTTRTHDYLDAYVSDLRNVVDFDRIRAAGLKLAVDPLGGAGVHYWAPIGERYKLDLTVVSDEVDPRFAFMTVDWDGRI
ncbi:MAG: alpha-D-glucose phosphate-specific phosphoglucomutase, partial [Rhodanobacteraceae bacterium]